jgi:hypothetical protein
MLLAERLREEHLGEIRRMHRDPDVMATLGVPDDIKLDFRVKETGTPVRLCRP